MHVKKEEIINSKDIFYKKIIKNIEEVKSGKVTKEYSDFMKELDERYK